MAFSHSALIPHLGLALNEAEVLQLSHGLFGEPSGPERLGLALEVLEAHPPDTRHRAPNIEGRMEGSI